MVSNFVDREKQIEFMNDLLKKLSSGEEIKKKIIEYYGIAGIGKTTLLKQIQSLCEEAEIPCVSLDFSSDFKNSDEEIALLSSVVSEVIKDESTEAIDFHNIVKEYYEVYKQIEGEEKISPELLHLRKGIAVGFNNCLRGHKLVLILDSVHMASTRTLAFFESEILVQLVSSNPIVSILASSKRIGWRSYSLKRLLSSTRLQPLTKEESAKHIKSIGKTEIADEIYEITNGHPMSNIVVKDLLKEIEIAIKRKLQREDFGDYERRLVKVLEEEIVHNQIMEDIDPELYLVFRVLSIPRRFNLKVLAKVLSTDIPSLSWDYDESQNLLEKLQSTGLVEWSEAKDYALDSTTRLILCTDMRFSNPAKYLEITKALVTYYEHIIQLEFDPQAVVEALYHLADQFRIEDQRYDVEIASGQIHRLQNWLQPFLRRTEQEKGTALLRLVKLKKLISSDESLLARIGYQEEMDILTETVDYFIEKAQRTKRIFLTIEKHSDTEQYGIKFDIEGEAVPLPTLEIPVSSSRKEQLMSLIRAAKSADDLLEIGKLVFTQFLPIPFQNRMRLTNDPLIIMVNEPEIPWELLHDGNEFVFLRIPVGRRILTMEESKKSYARRRKNLRFLLVGVQNPIVEVPESSGDHFQEIPETTNEIYSIASQLEANSIIDFNEEEDVLFNEKATGSEFLARLASGDYDVIHFAGHAHEGGESLHHSLVLYDEILSGANLANTVQGRPLVFLNGCRTAGINAMDIEGNYIGKIMIGLAHAFTLGGSLACVGNLWKISDTISTEFARIFYQNLLSGNQSVGESLRQTRIELRARGNEQSLNWASYVLYGDPTVFLF